MICEWECVWKNLVAVSLSCYFNRFLKTLTRAMKILTMIGFCAEKTAIVSFHTLHCFSAVFKLRFCLPITFGELTYVSIFYENRLRWQIKRAEAPRNRCTNITELFNTGYGEETMGSRTGMSVPFKGSFL
jgi:hypothetical protein